jgi:hypothetical protein
VSVLVYIIIALVLAYHHWWWFFIALAVVIVIRHAPWFANIIARDLDLDDTDGMTYWVARQALPAWGERGMWVWRHAALMSNDGDAPQENAPPPVPVPVPSTGGSPDTNAIRPNDNDSMREQYLVIMADQRDERGGYLFSANQIHAAIGGHRATVLARVRERRDATPQPVYRTEDGATAPAAHPITRDPHGPTH